VSNNNVDYHTDTATGCSPNEIQGFFYAHPQKCGCLSQTFGGSSEVTTLLFDDTGNGSRSCILPEMSNNNVVMKQKKTAILRVARKNPLICRIEYEHLSDLTQSVTEFLDGCPMDALITLPDGSSYRVTHNLMEVAV
jgi:hypothetical protein